MLRLIRFTRTASIVGCRLLSAGGEAGIMQAAPNSSVAESSSNHGLSGSDSPLSNQAVSGPGVSGSSQESPLRQRVNTAVCSAVQITQSQPSQSGRGQDSALPNMLDNQMPSPESNKAASLVQNGNDNGAPLQSDEKAVGKVGFPSTQSSHLATDVMASHKNRAKQEQDQSAEPDAHRRRSKRFENKLDFRTEKQIRDFLHTSGPNIKAEQIAQAFLAAQRLKPLPSRQLLERLTALVMTRVGSLTEQHIGSIFLACARCGYVKPELAEVLGRKLLTASRTRSMTDFVLTNLIHSLGILQRDHQRRSRLSPKEWFPSHQALARALSVEATKVLRLNTFQEKQFSQVAYGLSQMGVRDTKVWASIAMEVIEPRCLDYLGGQSLCSILHSFSQVGFREKEVIHKLVAALAQPKRLQELTEAGISSVFFSLRLLECRDWPGLRPLYEDACSESRLSWYNPRRLANLAYSCGKMRIKDQKLWSALGSRIAQPENLVHFTEQQLSNILSGAMLTDFHDQSVILPLAQEACRAERLGKYTAQGISTIWRAMGKLQLRDEEVLKTLWGEVTRPGFPHTFQTYDLAMCLEGNKQLVDVFPTSSVTETIVSEMVSRQDLSPLLLSWVLSILAQMNYKKPFDIKRLALTFTDRKRLSAATTDDIATAMFALGKLGFVETKALRRLTVEIQKPFRLASFSPTHLRLLLYGFAKVNYRDAGLTSAIVGCMKGRSQLKMLNHNHLQQLMKNYLKLQAPDREFLEVLGDEMTLPERLAPASNEYLIMAAETLAQTESASRETCSRLVEEICKPERLDLLAINSPSLVDVICTLPRLGVTDHALVRSMLLKLKDGGPSKVPLVASDQSRLLGSLEALGFPLDSEEAVAATRGQPGRIKDAESEAYRKEDSDVLEEDPEASSPDLDYVANDLHELEGEDVDAEHREMGGERT